MDEGITHPNKLLQTYMLPVLNTKEAHPIQICDKHNDIPEFKIGVLIMVKNVYRESNWDTKYVPNFRVIKLIGMRQLEFPDLTDRLWKVNILDIHKILPADFIVSCIPDELDSARISM